MLLLLVFGKEYTICLATTLLNCSILVRTTIKTLKLRYIVILITVILFLLSVCENLM